MFYYHAFGLSLSSTEELISFPKANPSAAPDVKVRMFSHRPHYESDLLPIKDGPVQNFEILGQILFRIYGDSCIDVFVGDQSKEWLLPALISGLGLGTALHMRGNLVLHACALKVRDRSVILCGDKGAGKSTTTGALIGAGHSLLADDVVCVNWDSNKNARIIPSFGQLKLCFDACEALDLQGCTRFPVMEAGLGKAILNVGKAFDPKPMFANDIFVLVPSLETKLEKLNGASAVAAIMRYTYVTRRPEYQWTPQERARMFGQCVELARTCNVQNLHVKRGHDLLDEVVAAIERG